MAEIQPVPSAILASEFPTNADRQAGEWNAKAKAWADSENAMVTRTRSIALSAHNNATVAQEMATAAQSSASAAASSAATANSHRIAAASSASAAAADAVKTAADRQAVESALADGPVLSVNGKSGIVNLTATDVGAVSQVNGKSGNVNLTATDVGAANTSLSNVTQANVRARAGTGTMAYRNLTVSTSSPTGGADGDVWFQVES